MMIQYNYPIIFDVCSQILSAYNDDDDDDDDSIIMMLSYINRFCRTAAQDTEEAEHSQKWICMILILKFSRLFLC